MINQLYTDRGVEILYNLYITYILYIILKQYEILSDNLKNEIEISKFFFRVSND